MSGYGGTFYNSAMHHNTSYSYPEELEYASSSNQLNTPTHYNQQSHSSSTNFHANDVMMTYTNLEDMNVQDQTCHQPSPAVNRDYRVQNRTSMGILQHNPRPFDQLLLNQPPSIHGSVAENKKLPVASSGEEDNQQFHIPAKTLDSPQIQDGYAMPAQGTVEDESTVNNFGTDRYFNFASSSNQASQSINYRQQSYGPSRSFHANNVMMASMDFKDINIQVTNPTHNQPLGTISAASPAVQDDQQFHIPSETSDSPQIRDGYGDEPTVNDGITHYIASSSNPASQLITYQMEGYWPSTNHHAHDGPMTTTDLEDINTQITQPIYNQPLSSFNSIHATTLTGTSQNCALIDNFMAINSETPNEESQLLNDFDEGIPFDVSYEAADVILEALECNNANVSGYNFEDLILNNDVSPELFSTLLPQEPATREENPTKKKIQPLKTKVGRPRKNKLQASTNNEEVPTLPKRKRGRPRKTTNAPESSTIGDVTITSATETSQNYVTKDRQAKRKPGFSYNEENIPESSTGCSGTSIWAKRMDLEDKENAEYLPEEELSEEELSDEEQSEEVTSAKDTDEERRKKNNLASKDSRKKLKEKLAQQTQLKEELYNDNLKLKELAKKLEEALESL